LGFWVFLGLSSLQMKMINEGSVFGSWKHLQKKIRCQIPHSKKIATGKEVKSFDSVVVVAVAVVKIWSKTFVLEKLQFDDNLTLGLIEALSFVFVVVVVVIIIVGCFNLSLLLLNFFKAKSFARVFCIWENKANSFCISGNKKTKSFCQSFAFERELCTHTNAIVILVFY